MRMRRKRNLDYRLGECIDRGILTAYKPEEDFSSFSECNSVLPSNVKNFELEIGCGKGGFIIQKALAEPEKTFVAVESVGNVMVTACETAIKQEINNVKFLLTDALYLPRLLNPGKADAIYLNFSCPYPKKRQANRRLTADSFLKVYDYLLSKEGCIFLKTDKPQFFTYSLEQLSAYGYKLKNISLSLHDDAIGRNNIVTEYEKKFTEQGLPIYYFEATRNLENKVNKY